MIIDKDNFSDYTNLLLEAQKINYDETLEEVIIAKLESWEFKNFLKLRCVRTEDIEKDMETFYNIQYELYANNEYYSLNYNEYFKLQIMRFNFKLKTYLTYLNSKSGCREISLSVISLRFWRRR